MFNCFLLIFFICCELNKLLHVFSCSMLQNNAFHLPSRPRLHASPLSLSGIESTSLSLSLVGDQYTAGPLVWGWEGERAAGSPNTDACSPAPTSRAFYTPGVLRPCRENHSNASLSSFASCWLSFALSLSLLKYDKRAPLPSVQSFFLP